MLNFFEFPIFPSRNTVNEKPSIYFYNSGDEQGTRHYYPANPYLQEIAKNLLYATEGKRPWEAYIAEGLQHLQVSSGDFSCYFQWKNLDLKLEQRHS